VAVGVIVGGWIVRRVSMGIGVGVVTLDVGVSSVGVREARGGSVGCSSGKLHEENNRMNKPKKIHWRFLIFPPVY
jgi:hypothetical protein